MSFDIEQTDELLSTTRAVRRRLDLDRDVPDELLLRCIELAEHIARRRDNGRKGQDHVTGAQHNDARLLWVCRFRLICFGHVGIVDGLGVGRIWVSS